MFELPSRQLEYAFPETARHLAVLGLDPTTLRGAFLRERRLCPFRRRRAVGGQLFGEKAIADNLAAIVRQRIELR